MGRLVSGAAGYVKPIDLLIEYGTGARMKSASEEFYGASAPAAVHYNMPAAEYHADSDGPRLSCSLAKLIANQSALHAWNAHPLLGAGPGWRYTPDTSDGTLIHSLVLEPDSEVFHEMAGLYKGEVVEDFRTNVAKEERDEAIARGKFPIFREKLDIFRYKAKAARSRFEDSGLRFDGDSEVVIYWTEETPHGVVRCRCRVDHLIVTHDRIHIIDLKSAEDANPRKLEHLVYQYGYDIQHAGYIRGVEAAFPEYAGRVDFTFAFCELEKPYAVNPQTLDAEYARIGEARWLRSRDTWAEALKLDKWRGYKPGAIVAPSYIMQREMMAGEP